jgi:hypothetical protein
MVRATRLTSGTPDIHEHETPASCELCGQTLADGQVIARYERNRAEREAQLLKRVRSEIRAELGAAYRQKALAEAAGYREKAEAAVRQTYDRRFRQMESTNQGLQEQLDVYKRRLENVSSARRGGFNEEDLLASLRREFPDDRIERVRSGPARRADIVHEVRCAPGTSKVAGCIIYECKDTTRWDSDFIAQARAAQEHRHATHAVVVSRAFPAKCQGFTMVDGIVVVDAAGMLVITRILRTSMIQLAQLTLSSEQRGAKGEELMRYLAGDDFRSAFTAVRGAAAKMHDSLAKERRQHDLTWAQRESCYRRMESGLSEIAEGMSQVLDRPSEGLPPTAGDSNVPPARLAVVTMTDANARAEREPQLALG